MDSVVARRIVRYCGLTTATLFLAACATTPPLAATRNQVIISVRDQKLTVVKEDHTRVSFPISTSKFGLGDRRGTYETPTGELAVAAKIGGGATPGSVFHGRVRTGEIVKVDAPGRDAIVTRILALKGLETTNQQAFSRGIYIHGTPEERNIGRPTSYGCIRMRSKDVIALYDMVKVGARVQIIDTTQNQAIAANIIRPDSAATPPFVRPTKTINVATNTLPSADGKPPVTTVTTTTTTAEGTSTSTTIKSPAGPSLAAGTPTAPVPGKKEWAGTPKQLLAKEAAAEAKSKTKDKPPVGAPTSARPVSNNSNDNGGSNILNRSALDSL